MLSALRKRVTQRGCCTLALVQQALHQDMHHGTLGLRAASCSPRTYEGASSVDALRQAHFSSLRSRGSPSRLMSAPATRSHNFSAALPPFACSSPTDTSPIGHAETEFFGRNSIVSGSPFREWRSKARHRAATFSTAAVRLRRDGRPQQLPAGPQTQTGQQPQPSQRLPQAAQQDADSLASALALAGTIPATDWIARNPPWMQQPADGVTWPSQIAWTPEAAQGVMCPQRTRLTLNAETLEVLPIWIAVHQQHPDGVARLYESICPLDEALVDRLTCYMEPFCITSDLAFTRCDFQLGPWRNYFLGVIGAFAPDEDDVLWPNQVLHGRRTRFNLRNGIDLAEFLADPTREAFDNHSSFLEQIQAERGYRKGWSRHKLRARWGDETLAEFGIEPEQFRQ